ncbi:MAG: phosphoglycolate phosphatase [Hyphomicrobiaceae bacterium]
MTAVIFDLDGTLVESAPVIRDVANRLLGELDQRSLTLEEVQRFVGDGTRVFLQRMLEAVDYAIVPDAFEPMHERLLQYHSEAPGHASTPMPNADSALRSLHADGMLLGMCTNKPDAPTRNIIAANNWTGLFGAVVAGDSLPQRKPDPEPLRESVRQLSARHAVFVGDSDVDAATAAAADIPFLMYTEGYSRRDASELRVTASFSNFADLPALVRNILSKSNS